ncbi:hypothetical protein Ddc_19757 [Ditylenchus destructor]|nr:hypothetical protein Ddc_19757 [Ditylenchus destructor]
MDDALATRRPYGRRPPRRRGSTPPAPAMPEPAFLLEPPLRLALRDHRPHYQGPLTLLIGPDRVEGGCAAIATSCATIGSRSRQRRRRRRLSAAAEGRWQRLVPARRLCLSARDDRAARLCRAALPEQLQLPQGREGGLRNWSSAPSSGGRGARRHRRMLDGRHGARARGRQAARAEAARRQPAAHRRARRCRSGSGGCVHAGRAGLQPQCLWNLCQLISRLRRSSEKGTYRCTLDDIGPQTLDDCIVIACPIGWRRRRSCCRCRAGC